MSINWHVEHEGKWLEADRSCVMMVADVPINLDQVTIELNGYLTVI
jgi:hypothetical protein